MIIDRLEHLPSCRSQNQSYSLLSRTFHSVWVVFGSWLYWYSSFMVVHIRIIMQLVGPLIRNLSFTSPPTSLTSWIGLLPRIAAHGMEYLVMMQEIGSLSYPHTIDAFVVPFLHLFKISHLFLYSTCPPLSLTGLLPNGFFSSFKQLEIIDLSYNMFFGQFPADTLPPTLKFLNISINNFSGTIPHSICIKSPGLETVDFSFNNFIGNIPQGFGTCSSLQVLSLGFNNLTWIIPIDIDGAR